MHQCCKILNQLSLILLWSTITTTHCSWLAFGRFRGLQKAIGPRMCDQLSLVPKQKAMCLEYESNEYVYIALCLLTRHAYSCYRDPIVMDSVADGAFHGIQECQHQFKNERWNCSTIVKGQTIFGKVINQGSREASFVHAITTAGVMHAVTRACSRGDINSCSCNNNKYGPGNDEQGAFAWGGCSDDIGNGTYFIRQFVDASESDVHDARAQMNLHNNRAGTRAVKRFVKRQCQCHGKTASCTLRTCWESLGDFRETGDYLKERYDNAVRVTVTQNGPKATVASADGGNQPSKNDLVYLENSPNYCNRNSVIGTFGTAGRECNATSNGSDGCDKLCCGRGYVTKKVKKIEQHMCEFHWCCEVRCKEREQIMDVHTCNGEDEFDVAENPSVSSTERIPTTASATKAARGRRRGKKPRRKKPRGRKRKNRDGKKRKGKKRNRREVSYHVSTNIRNTRLLSRRVDLKNSHHKRFGAGTRNR